MNLNVLWVYAANVERLCESFFEIAIEARLVNHNPYNSNTDGTDVYSDSEFSKNAAPRFDAVQLVLDWLRHERSGPWLMIIDNADDESILLKALRSEASQSKTLKPNMQNVHSELPKVAHGAILITTRNRELAQNVTSGPANIIEVPKMDETEAKQLMIGRLSTLITDVTDLLVLNNELTHLPLAMIQASAFMYQNSLDVSQYLNLYRRTPAPLLEEDFCDIERDVDATNAVMRTFDITFAHIKAKNPTAVAILCLISRLDGQSVSRFLLEYLVSVTAFQETISLATFNLITEGKNLTPDVFWGRIDHLSLVKSLGKLKSFALLTGSNDIFAMHKFVKQATLGSIKRSGDSALWNILPVAVVQGAWPSRPETTPLELVKTQAELFPHVLSVLNFPLREPLDSESYVKQHSDSVLQAMAVDPENRKTVTVMGCFDLKIKLLEYLYIFLSERLDFEPANKTRELILELSKSLKGDRDPETYYFLGRLGESLCNSRDFAKAAEPLTTAATQLRELCRSDDRRYLSINVTLAHYYAVINEQSRAEELVNAVMSVSNANTDITLVGPATITMSSIYCQQQNFSKVMKVLSQTVDIIERKWGFSDLRYISYKRSLGFLHARCGDAETSIKILTEVLSIYHGAFGDEYAPTLLLMTKMVGILVDFKAYDKASKLGDRVVSACKTVRGYELECTIGCLQYLAAKFRTANLVRDYVAVVLAATPLLKSVRDPGHEDISSHQSALNQLAYHMLHGGCLESFLEIEEASQHLTGRGFHAMRQEIIDLFLDALESVFQGKDHTMTSCRPKVVYYQSYSNFMVRFMCTHCVPPLKSLIVWWVVRKMKKLKNP